jgi:hypothetical protein
VLGLPGGSARDQSLHGDVFVEIRPVDANAITEKFELPAFSGRPVRQTGIPREGDHERAAVNEIHDQGVLVDLNSRGPWLRNREN